MQPIGVCDSVLLILSVSVADQNIFVLFQDINNTLCSPVQRSPLTLETAVDISLQVPLTFSSGPFHHITVFLPISAEQQSQSVIVLSAAV